MRTSNSHWSIFYVSYEYVGDECSRCVALNTDVCHDSNEGMRCLQYIPLARL